MEAVAGGMYENTDVNVKITMGNIPLTIAQDAPQFGIPIQSPNQNDPTNSAYPVNLPAPIPGFAQQVPPYGQPPFTSPNPQLTMDPTLISSQPPSLYPQMQTYNQSQLPYPDVNIQQPAFNPSYPTAPSL